MQVREITDPRPTFAQNSVEWKRSLTTEQYIEAEYEIDSIVSTRYWAVFEEDTMVASCRAYIRPAIVNGSTATEACIGNVFTDVKYRGKGYAGEMLKSVTKTLTSAYQLVTLWSDIGLKYYAKFGFRAFGDQHTLSIHVNALTEWPQGVSPVNAARLPDIAAIHTKTLKENLGENEIATSPESPLYDLWVKTSVVAARYKAITLPDIWGATFRGSWCVWYYNLSGSLVILAISGADIEPLLAAAHHMAAGLELPLIEVYPDSLIASDLEKFGGVIKPRQKSLSMYISEYKLAYPGKYAWF